MYATVTWTPTDIQTIAARLTDEEATTFLERNAKHIQERLTEQGWQVIETLLAMDGIECINSDDLEYEQSKSAR